MGMRIGCWSGWPAVAALGLLAVAGCAPPKAADRLPSQALDHFNGDTIGDPATCVLLAERPGGKVVYRYGAMFNCVRGLPACDRPGFLSATQALTLADNPTERGASCPSVADGSRMVGWAEGRVASPRRSLVYSAVMEGETAMPGHEIAARLDAAFQKAGL
jgi:hypothetical protein